MPRTVIAIFLTLAGASVLAVSSKRKADEIAFPNGFRGWFGVNSMVVTKNSVPFSPIAGMHSIHVNEKGRTVLEDGGPFPYPDGTIFADDVHEFSEVEGSYIEGQKKAVTVMVKDTRRYAQTGGWGFQAWENGDPSKPIVHSTAQAVSASLSCHTPRKAQDYVYSTFIP